MKPLTEYFAVIDADERRGPFPSMLQAGSLLKQVSQDRGHTDEQARHFFLHESAVEMLKTVDGNSERVRLIWMGRQESGRKELSPEKQAKIRSRDEIARTRENDLADAHFNVTVRKAAEVNEGGLVDPRTP